MGIGQNEGTSIDHSALLRGLALDLRLPLLQIKTNLENLYINKEFKIEDIDLLSLSAEAGLRLVEAYITASSLDKQIRLELEPVAISAILEDAAQLLSPYAKSYGTELEVSSAANLQPVLTHKKTTLLAFTVLGESLIRGQISQSSLPRQTLVFGAHRYRQQIIAGIFGNFDGLTIRNLNVARVICGIAQQPISALAAHASSGILVADQLCRAFSRPLQSSQHGRMNGLATVVPISNQLQLI